MLPDWVWSVVAMIVIGLVGWVLLQEVETEKRLARLETAQEHQGERMNILSEKIIPLLEAR